VPFLPLLHLLKLDRPIANRREKKWFVLLTTTAIGDGIIGDTTIGDTTIGDITTIGNRCSSLRPTKPLASETSLRD
jgi:hypothetical protein